MIASRLISRVATVGAATVIATLGLAGLGASGADAGTGGPVAPGYTIMTGSGTNTGFGSAPTYPNPGGGNYSADACGNINGGQAGIGQTPSCVGLSGDKGGAGYWYVGNLTKQFSATGNSVAIGVLSAQGTVFEPAGGCLNASDNYGTIANLDSPIVGVSGVGTYTSAVANARTGAWMVGSDGGIFAMCGAPYFGSMGGTHLNKPIVGIATTPDGLGYWEVASDGGIFSFGDAAFYGSMGGSHLNKPIVGMASSATGNGYWLVASDGGIFTYGDAVFSGSMGGSQLNSPMVAMAANTSGSGYWTVAADGGVFSYGDAPFLGSLGAQKLFAPVVGIAVRY